MRHDIHISGHAFCLRPIALTDARLIVSLRSDTDRTRHLHRIPRDVATQESYLNTYFDRAGDYYFVIDRLVVPHDRAEGVIGIYDVDTEHRRAEWGRWVIYPQSLAAIESAWLVYRVGFERLDLEEMYCHTLADNTAVLSFHDNAGLVRHKRLEAFHEIDGKRWDVIEHVLKRDQWPETSITLARRAERLAQRLSRAG